MTQSTLQAIEEQVKARFELHRRVLSFGEYLDWVAAEPTRATRDAARYLHDAFNYYGYDTITRPWGTQRRWNLFDQDFLAQQGEKQSQIKREALVGQEVLQNHVYQSLQGFLQEGRANRLLLLHGPNGSAKSTFVACIMRALEHYSHQDEGALYSFAWVFPKHAEQRGIGFADGEIPTTQQGSSYAHLDEAFISAKLPSELREHPLFLLPLQERHAWLKVQLQTDEKTSLVPDWVMKGQLSHKHQHIFQALLGAYRGDLARVLAHIRVERFYISRRYRCGAVTVGPQMAVDAHERQITADYSLNALPASLSALNLYQSGGELVDAAGGILEFSDLLKRPLDAWKYLLLAIENGEVALATSILPINSVMIASSNEMHLHAFRDHHEYHSFRGRIRFLRAPYLLDYTQEQQIYDRQSAGQHAHIAPHVTHIIALWAVLTRMQRCPAELFEDPTLGELAQNLAPLEKADLYALGQAPKQLSSDHRALLQQHIGDLYHAFDNMSVYEGIIGASPRDMYGVLLEAANDARFDYVSPMAILERLRAFCQRGDHAFLKQEQNGDYHNAELFVDQVEARWLERVDEELKFSSGMVDSAQHAELFSRYVTHVSYWVKQERVYNAVTGNYEDPDAQLFQQVEEGLGLEEEAQVHAFRHRVIRRIAAYAIDHPDEDVDHRSLFGDLIERLEETTYQARKGQLAQLAEAMVQSIHEPEHVAPELIEPAQESLAIFKNKFGYQDASLRDALHALLRHRYQS